MTGQRFARETSRRESGGVRTANNLQLIRTSFVGRESPLADVGMLLDGAAVVTLVGPRGVGKTRLAIEFARCRLGDFPDGVWLADLAPVSSADAVAAEVAVLFGVTPGAGDLLALLTEYIGARCVLLVLDNCEHVVDDVAMFVERLVRACPNLRVLCTSRAPLDLGAEVAYRVEPLPKSADAVQLFLERARAAAPDMAFTAADLAVLTQICDRLDRVEAEPTIETALKAYEERRRPRVGWIQEQSRALAESFRIPPRDRNPVLRECGQAMLHQRFLPLVANP